MIECLLTQSRFEPYSPETTARMLGIDRDSVVDIANEYLSYVDEELDELQIAIKDDDYKRIAFASHKIKGVTANLGMVYASKMASHINTHAEQTIKVDYNLYYATLERLLNIANNQLQTQVKTK